MTSSWYGHQIFIWIRLRQVLCSMLKPMPPCSVARYSLTGMVTRPNWMAPRHMDRAMMMCLVFERAPSQQPTGGGAFFAGLEADILRALGFNVVSCARIVDLGELMAVALPHLLVVDVMLPDGDGGDIAELLRETWPGIPAVFVSAASRNRLSELAPLGPVVAKPFDVDRFREAVLTAVEAPADRWRIR